jgi:hypothetical protein
LKANRAYSLGAYIKIKEQTQIRFEIKQKGKVIDQVTSNNDIEYSNDSSWKFIKLDFELGNNFKNTELHCIKLGKGEVYIDNIGIIPIPESK